MKMFDVDILIPFGIIGYTVYQAAKQIKNFQNSFMQNMQKPQISQSPSIQESLNLKPEGIVFEKINKQEIQQVNNIKNNISQPKTPEPEPEPEVEMQVQTISETSIPKKSDVETITIPVATEKTTIVIPQQIQQTLEISEPKEPIYVEPFSGAIPTPEQLARFPQFFKLATPEVVR